jgi:hypothetical protein
MNLFRDHEDDIISINSLEKLKELKKCLKYSDFDKYYNDLAETNEPIPIIVKCKDKKYKVMARYSNITSNIIFISPVPKQDPDGPKDSNNFKKGSMYDTSYYVCNTNIAYCPKNMTTGFRPKSSFGSRRGRKNKSKKSKKSRKTTRVRRMKKSKKSKKSLKTTRIRRVRRVRRSRIVISA